MSYSRQGPSARYVALINMYRDLHLHGESSYRIPAKNTFDGRSLPKEAVKIKRLIERTGARTILDYGSGKGRQYGALPTVIENEGKWDSIVAYWGVDAVSCFDPAYPPYSALPSGTFDGVVSTDVLEHCPEEDIDWILREIFGYADRFVYLAIACYPATKQLPNGENAHCTIRPPEWWQRMLEQAAATRPGVSWEAWLELGEGHESNLVRLRGGELFGAR